MTSKLDQITNHQGTIDLQAAFCERRSQRSENRQEALELQLAYVKEQFALEAMVLCDDLGEVVASAGETGVVNSLAEQLPWLVASPPWQMGDSLSYLWEVCPGIDEERIVLRTLTSRESDESLILCGIGESNDLADGVDRTLTGVHRIYRTTLH